MAAEALVVRVRYRDPAHDTMGRYAARLAHLFGFQHEAFWTLASEALRHLPQRKTLTAVVPFLDAARRPAKVVELGLAIFGAMPEHWPRSRWSSASTLPWTRQCLRWLVYRSPRCRTSR